MAAIQVNVRVPEILLSRIDKDAGDGERSKWILDACRMRLDGLAHGPNDPHVGGAAQSASSFTQGNTKSLGLTEEFENGEQPPLTNEEKMQALRYICAGADKRVAAAGVHGLADLLRDKPNFEIPICGKDWWEDGDHFECLMDAGHREQKHGMRGMVRKLDA